MTLEDFYTQRPDAPPLTNIYEDISPTNEVQFFRTYEDLITSAYLRPTVEESYADGGGNLSIYISGGLDGSSLQIRRPKVISRVAEGLQKVLKAKSLTAVYVGLSRTLKPKATLEMRLPIIKTISPKAIGAAQAPLAKILKAKAVGAAKPPTSKTLKPKTVKEVKPS